MIKLVACDLDGTLFNSQMAVSTENAQAIQAAQKNGIEFLVATGRSPSESQRLLKKANLHTGFINLNGGMVFDPAGRLLIKQTIPRHKAKAIMNLLRQERFYFEVITGKNVYSESLSQRVVNVAHFMVALNPQISFKQAVAISAGNPAIMQIQSIHDFSTLLTQKSTEIFKIIAFSRHGQKDFARIKSKLKVLGGLAVTSSAFNNIEINSEKAQKGTALLSYAKIKGIPSEQTAAIGDNLNDESMIKQAGVGVAMGNAVPQIKQIAQVITKSNNENGVAFILKQFMRDNRRAQE